MAQQDLTPDELETIRQIIAAHSAGSPGTPTEAYSGMAAPLPATDPAAGYNAQASSYNSKADALDKAAAVPYPKPVGVGQSIVAGLRNGMESFGRLGAPGGTEGQEAFRQKQFDAQNQTRIEQAKALRGQAQQQQDLGQRTTYEAGALQSQKDQLAQTTKFQDAETTDRRAAQAQAEKVSNRPVGNDIPTGGLRVFTDPNTGKEIPDTEIAGPDKQQTPKSWHYQELNVEGKPEVWAIDPDTGVKHHKVGDANPISQPGGASGGMQVVQSTGPDGKPIYARVKVSGPEGPIQVDNPGGTTPKTTVATAAEGNKNAAADSKMTVDLSSAERMLNTMQATLDRINSGKSQAPGADDMVLLSNHLAMTFGGVKGARVGRDLIEAHLKARDLPSDMEVLAQKVYGGGVLTPAQRSEFVELAKRNVQSMRQGKTDLDNYFGGGMPDATAPAPAAAGSVPTVGGTFNNEKVKSVTRIQ